MKKMLALTLVCLLVFCGTSVAFAADVISADGSAAQAPSEQHKLYLVPGVYLSDGQKVENAIASGAQKLTLEQCDGIFTENAYLCDLKEGSDLPVPTSRRADKNGNPYVFNGWWTITDSMITYFDKVPAVTQTTFLYADWRADLSQRKDPVAPDENPQINSPHYMTVKRADGKTETLVLRVSGTDRDNAEQLGYGSPVQLYNEWFELSKGDVITVYTKGLDNSDSPKVAPVLINNYREIALESSGDGSNVTANYLSSYAPLSKRENPSMTCIAEASRHYRIYIKFFFGGSSMAVYMEPMD